MVTQGGRGGGVVSGLRKASDNFLDDGKSCLVCGYIWLWVYTLVKTYQTVYFT